MKWLPGYKGIKGNEEIIRLTRVVADSSFIGPKPFYGLNCSYRMATVKKGGRRITPLFGKKYLTVDKAKFYCLFRG